MNRQDVEKIVTEYLKPIFGFALKRCKNIHDAEDLSQEIVTNAFRALLVKDDVSDMGKFIWTVAHNALSNYYRDAAKSMLCVSVDEVANLISEPYSESDADDNAETVRRLQTEIAYLSKLQRRIVIAYYFEQRKQADIAMELGIPLGTVKWHLFEAKKELKRGMDTMRKASELKFNPIKFHSYGINGSVGKKSPDEFFRSTLAQNICYCVRNTAKTINEIADDLGVSPVYVETEVEFLEEYGFLQAQKDKYIVGFIISEPTAELLTMQNDMYKRAAELFANDLYDELTSSGILDDPDIWCGQTDQPISLTESPKADHNFILWTLIPYIATWSGEKLMDESISFEEVATIRPDGAHNIYHASVYDAEDLTQETLLAALSYMARGKDIQDVKAWLLVVMGRKFNDMLRKRYKQPIVSIGDGFDIVDENALIKLNDKDDEAENVRKAVAYLAKNYREVIVRYYMNGQSVSQIASELGIPEGTVKSRLYLGRDHVKKGISDMEKYSKQSYSPITLHVSFSGNPGLDGEPISLIKNDLIAQNIL